MGGFFGWLLSYFSDGWARSGLEILALACHISGLLKHVSQITVTCNVSPQTPSTRNTTVKQIGARALYSGWVYCTEAGLLSTLLLGNHLRQQDINIIT